ncbi:hypothetical protein ACFSTI_22235 [Rhizorhabdus histidinilytica]
MKGLARRGYDAEADRHADVALLMDRIYEAAAPSIRSAIDTAA